MGEEPWVAIAEIVAPHGVKGEVRVRPLGCFPERFRPGLNVRLEEPGDWRRIERVRRHGDVLLLKLEGIDDRTRAETLRRRRLWVPYSQRHPLPPNTFYVDDLRGLPVEKADGTRLGVLRDVLENPANDLFAIQLESGEEVLIPAVREFVTVDLQAGRVIVRPIPGMLPEEDADAP